MRTGKNSTDLSKPAVVGPIHSPQSLAVALKTTQSGCDLFELRLDAFSETPAELLRAAPRLRLPLIITARHPAEGGAGGLTAARRRGLYRKFMRVAAMVDIDLRSAREMSDVAAEARQAGVKVILSCHHFQTTPSEHKLRLLCRRAREAGADVFKVATLADTAKDLAVLLSFLSAEKGRMPISAMGMGRFGRISRLALAQAGSCLNYGYLGAPNASGQWPADVLKERIKELLAHR